MLVPGAAALGAQAAVVRTYTATGAEWGSGAEHASHSSPKCAAWEDSQLSEKGIWGCFWSIGISFLSHFSYSHSIASSANPVCTVGCTLIGHPSPKYLSQQPKATFAHCPCASHSEPPVPAAPSLLTTGPSTALHPSTALPHTPHPRDADRSPVLAALGAALADKARIKLHQGGRGARPVAVGS